MERTEMKFVRFDNADVITSSGPVPDKFTFKLNGINDFIKGNASITAFRNGVEDSVFTNSSTGNAAGAVNFLNGFLGNGTVKGSDSFLSSDGEFVSISQAFATDEDYSSADSQHGYTFITGSNFNNVSFEWLDKFFRVVQ